MKPMRHRLLRTMLTLGGFALVLWIALVGLLLLSRHERIYPQSQSFDAAEVDGLPRGRLARLTAADGTPILAWVAPPVDGQPVMLHFTGNAGHVPSMARHVTPLAIRGWGVAILVPRGAGGAPGAPSEEALIGDALTLYDALPSLFPEAASPPAVWGVSLGAALATAVAVERPVSAAILEVPFAQLCSVAEHHYPWSLACFLLWDERWDSIDRIPRLEAPLLILAGERDRTVPVAEARRLFAAAPEPKELIVYPRGAHNDLMRYGAMDDVLEFLRVAR
ncbi:MAG: hypothetical protein AAF416_03010 [Pseudomonadota bacterium]